MKTDVAGMLTDLIDSRTTSPDYTAVLASWDPTTGIAQLLTQTNNAVPLQAQVSPLLRMAGAQLIRPGVIVGVKKYPGRPPYIVDVLDGAAAIPGSGVVAPSDGNPSGLGAASYQIQLSQLALASFLGSEREVELWLAEKYGLSATGAIGIPTVAVGVDAGGGAPAPSVVGNDQRGVVSCGTGTAPNPVAGKLVTVVFGAVQLKAPYVLVVAANAAAAPLQPYIATAGTGGFTIGVAVAPSSSVPASWYKFTYLVLPGSGVGVASDGG